GEMRDVPFMDALQKKHSKMVGFMPTAQFEGNIKAGRVLIAEEVSEDVMSENVKSENVRSEDVKREGVTGAESSRVFTSSRVQQRTPVGYILGVDRYFKRDDVGIIYQLNVVPGKQRGLVGAALLKAQFEKSA